MNYCSILFTSYDQDPMRSLLEPVPGIKQETPLYVLSRLFYIFNPENELYTVLSVLKRLSELARNGSSEF